MSCNCLPVCEIPKCVERIQIGIIEPNNTVLVQFKDIITGRIQQASATSDDSGLLIVEVTDINSFFSENFTYEVSILPGNINQCDTYLFTIDDTEDIECATLKFVNLTNETAIFKLK